MVNVVILNQNAYVKVTHNRVIDNCKLFFYHNPFIWIDQNPCIPKFSTEGRYFILSAPWYSLRAWHRYCHVARCSPHISTWCSMTLFGNYHSLTFLTGFYGNALNFHNYEHDLALKFPNRHRWNYQNHLRRVAPLRSHCHPTMNLLWRGMESLCIAELHSFISNS